MNELGFQRAQVLWSCPRKVGQGRKTAGFELRAGFLPWYPLYFNFLFFMLESKKRRFTSENIALRGGIRCAQKNCMKVWIFTGSLESFFFGFPHGFL